MIHYEPDLDGEQVIQTSILRAFCRKERHDEKGKGAEQHNVHEKDGERRDTQKQSGMK